MAREYLTEEFLSENIECPLEEQIDKKVSLLYDLCKLHKSGKTPDAREHALRQYLATCQTEMQIDNAVRNVVLGNCTLNDILKRKGYLN